MEKIVSAFQEKRPTYKFLFIVLLFFLFNLIATLNAQDSKYTIGVSPAISWMTTNDAEIRKNGAAFGTTFSFRKESFNIGPISFFGGIDLSINKGGRLRYDTGGNLLPLSDFTDPSINTGLKPLDDGTNIKYNMTYLEVPIGMKVRIEAQNLGRFYIDLPIISAGYLLKSEADIQTLSNLYEGEPVGPDLNKLKLGWATGFGLEYDTDSNFAFVIGLQYDQSFNDVTKNNGVKAIPDENGQGFTLVSEISKGILNTLSLRLGILF